MYVDKESLNYKYKVTYVSSLGLYQRDHNYVKFSVTAANCQIAAYKWINSMTYHQSDKISDGDIIVVCPEIPYSEHLLWKLEDPKSKAFMKASFSLDRKQGVLIPKTIEMCVSRHFVVDDRVVDSYT